MPSKKKKYNARFPPARIKKIMQTDDEVGKVAAAVPVIISRALELFVEALVRRGSEITKSRNAKTLTTSHLKACILSEESFEFLTDLVTAIPDVQAEEELGTPQPTDNMQGHFPLLNRSTPKQSSRGRRSRNGENAGPSHSTTEDTDSYDEDDLEDEEEEGESSENTGSDTHHGQRELYIPHAEVHSMGAALLGTNNSADDEDDEDYDA